MKRNSWISLILAVIMALSITAGTSVSVKADSGQDDLEVIWFEGEGWKDKNFYRYLGEGLCLAGTNHKYAIVDMQGNMVTFLANDMMIGSFREGMAKVWKGEGRNNNLYGFINTEGDIVVPCIYKSAGDFHEGLAMVNTSGFIDKQGKIVIPCIYSNASDFCEGLAEVKKEDKYGFIDKQGKVVIPFTYAHTHDDDELRLYVNPSSLYYQNDYRVRNVYNALRHKGHHFHEGLALVTSYIRDLGAKRGFVNKQGKIIVPFIYDGASDFYEGLARVKVRDNPYNDRYNRWGFVDSQGNVAVSIVYDMVGTFHEGLARVKMGKWGFVDKQGNGIIPNIYSAVGAFHDGVAPVKKDGKYGLIDRQGNLVVPLIYDELTNGKYNKNIEESNYGEKIDNYNISEGLYGGYGDEYVNQTTAYFEIPFYEGGVRFFPSGIIQVAKYDEYGDKVFFINKQGKPLSLGFESIKIDDNNGAAYVTDANGRKGIIKSSLPKEDFTPVIRYGLTANYSKALFNIDGKDYDNVEGYTINGSTYYKLRDVAELLRQTDVKFSVEWNEAKKTIIIGKGKEYVGNGSELKPGDRQTKKARVVNGKIEINGKSEEWMGYSINGYTYFPIRDLGNKLDFEVEWGEPANYKDNRGRINIGTAK